MRKILIEFVPGLLGGVVGGVIGYFIVLWIRRQGFYAAILPGALSGLGCGLMSRTNSNARGVLAALIAACAGLLTEWLAFYLPRDITFENFSGFMSKFGDQPPITKIMLAVGIILGFYWGRECTLRSRLKTSERSVAKESGSDQGQEK